MGKIQEEFETWLNKDITNDEYKFANTTFNEFYSFLDEDNSKEIFMKVGFQGGRKSRDEEITRLMEIIECKNILLIAYRLGTSRGVEKALGRLEALKDIT